ncbi:MAG: hypothetical protein MJ252_08830 [archaeon]|nr:hypothetical protein [archaeon]
MGDTKIDYQTSSRDQSKLIPKQGVINNRLSPEEKLKMQSSQFTLGCSPNEYFTNYNTEYYDKLPLQSGQRNECKDIKNKFLASKYIMGNDKVKWDTMNQREYTPKKLENNRYAARKQNTEFKSLKEDRDFRSEAMLSWNEKPLTNNKLSPERISELRGNHFKLSNGDDRDMNTKYKIDYVDPRLQKVNQNYISCNIDPRKYRESQWSMSGENKVVDFSTTYGRTMTPKKYSPNEGYSNAHLSTIKIGEDKNQPEDYKSAYVGDYGKRNLFDSNYYLHNEDKDMARSIRKNNSNSHLETFKGKGEYDTTMNHYYKYDEEEAKNARNKLSMEKKMKLKGSNYKLSEGDEFEKETSNKRDYVPYKLNKIERIQSGSRNNDSMGINQGLFDGQTTYNTEYTKKPLPVSDYEYFENYLKRRYKEFH